MNRSQLIGIVLIIALVVNTLFHFFHPAYREYRRMSDAVNLSFESFRKDVLDSFVPVVSNIVDIMHSQQSLQLPVDAVADVVRTSMPFLVGSRVQDTADLSYARVADRDYVVLNGSLPLSLGDDLWGYPIRRITSTSVTTDATTYLFAPPIPSAPSVKDIRSNDNR